MKKVMMMVAAALMAAVSVSAQSAGEMFIKPMVGGTLSTFTKIDDTKMKLGLVGGAEFGYQVADPFAVTAGLLVAMQGSSYKDNDYAKDVKGTTTMLNIPILANYYIIPGLAIKAGIQPGILLAAKAKGEERLSSGSWQEYDSSSTEGLKKVDISIPIGISYEFSDFVIDARYNLGLTKVMDDGDAKNSVIMLTLGYKIPF